MKKFSVLVYLAEGYESKWNKIDHLCLLRNLFTDRSIFWNYIGNGEKQVSHHLHRGHHMFSLLLVLSLSFTDFISFISEWSTAVRKFHNFFFIESFSKLFHELRLCFSIIPSNYRPKIDMFISPIKEVIKRFFKI